MTIIHQFTRRKIAFAKKLLCLDFLRDCKLLKITPKFLQIKGQVKTHLTYMKIVKNAEFKLLQKCIKTLRKTTAKEEMILYYMHLDINANRPAAEFDKIVCNIQCKIEQITDITKEKHKEKLDKLTTTNHKNKLCETNDPENVFNLTDYKPSHSEKRILNQGPKFNPRVKLDVEKTITGFEKCLQNIPETIRNPLRGYIVW